MEDNTKDIWFENLKKDWQSEKSPQFLDTSKEIRQKAIQLKKQDKQKAILKAIFYFGGLLSIWVISLATLQESQISFFGLSLLSISLLLPALYQIWYAYKWAEINFVQLPNVSLKSTLLKLESFKKLNFYIKILTIMGSVTCLILGLQPYFDSFLPSHKVHKLLGIVIILVLIDAIFFRYKKVKQEAQKFTELIDQLEKL